MTMKTYQAAFHGGAVHYEADIDLAKGTNKCNCSICTKSRTWFAIVPAGQVRNITGIENLADYRWTTPERPESTLRFQFCKTCGVRAYAWGDHPAMGGKFYAEPVTMLDNVDPDELAAAPINYVDGRNNDFNAPPVDIRNL